MSRVDAFGVFLLTLAACAGQIPGGGEEHPATNNVAPASGAATIAETSLPTRLAAQWLEAHRHRPPMLRAFVQRMPKGGDLHSHLSGAVYAESYLEWAAAKDFCVDLMKDKLVQPPCGQSDETVPAKDLLEDAAARNALIDRLSTRNLEYAGQSGHDQFFAAFGGFGAMSSPAEHGIEMLTEVANRAAAQHVQYLEIMLTFEGRTVRELGKKRAETQWRGETDFQRERQWLLSNGLPALVEKVRRELKDRVRQYLNVLACDSPQAQPACNVKARFIAQTTRTNPPEQVFAQLVYAFELARDEPLVVGINLVAPEDDPVALRDYTLHMKMVGFLARQAPEINISLHAGELALGLVRPQDLRSHVRQAVEIARARRIGHGVDVLYEDEPFGLMAKMKERGVLVEICLTSNDVILGVKDANHPLPDYLRAQVPVALASDDEGVSRIDLSNEYLRAALSYNLTYPDLKRLARNSLEHSFLPGESLWRSTAPFTRASACAQETPGAQMPSKNCDNLLQRSERAREQWRLEAGFAEFENLPWLR